MTKWTTDRYPHFKFCPTLAYVHLKVTPTLESEKKQLKTPTEQADWRENVSCSLEILFDWLTDKKRKGVERIIKLVVEDNEEFPCSESTIKYCLKKLKDVRYLDWRRPNMSIQTLVEANATNVIELWLYSNGYKAVLSSWTDQGGLQTLHKVR